VNLIIASDGSRDASEEIVRANSDRGVRLVANSERRGKAACLNDAVGVCTSEIVVLADVRQVIERHALQKLVGHFEDSEIGAVSGELVFGSDSGVGFGQGVDAYWTYEKFVRRQESLVHSVVGATGAFYAIRKSAFIPIPCGTILDDVLIPMHVARQGLRVILEDGARIVDQPSIDHLQEQKRKVRTAAGNFQLLMDHKWLLSPFRNPLFLQFISHKVARLIAPFALIAVFFANLLLASTSSLYGFMFAGQLIFYGLAVLGATSSRAGDYRLVTVCKAFVYLNWFALLGLFEVMRNRRAHLWR
jgi:cellulose synthase/poly-beta-1,6-N-acetylglucosamine synthase-like glycosyltransferase